MVLPVTQTTLTTSNDEINKYKELYSDLVSAFAKLHNANMAFLINQGREPGFAVRKELRALEEISKTLKKQCQLVNKEGIKNNRIKKKLQQLENRAKKKKKKKNDMGVSGSNS